MRNEFCLSLVKLAYDYPLIFLTGDVGFMALEPLRERLAERFINAGIAEQNMISVAAGLTLTGAQAWVYSIAPFCYARPFEQIRNDVCLSKLPVKLVGNGGGYAYGSMGGTHHALEDYGILSTLPAMRIYVPAFGTDIDPIVKKIAALSSPSYLRLGRCELPKGFTLPSYSPWRCLLKGKGSLILGIGPLIGSLLNFFAQQSCETRPEIWVVSELPLTFEDIPVELLQRITHSPALCIVEEHVAHGGMGQNLIWLLAKHNIPIPYFTHAYAKGYLSGTYGSQQFHRTECGLDPESIAAMLNLREKKYD